MTLATTSDVGATLARYMRETETLGRGDPDLYRDLVALMVEAPCETTVDVLALVSWASALLPHALAAMPDDGSKTGGPRALVAVALNMTLRAAIALENTTGLPREAFIGPDRPAN